MTAMAARPALFVLLLLAGGQLSPGVRVQVGKVVRAGGLNPDELAEALSASADAALAGGDGGGGDGEAQAVQGGDGKEEAPPPAATSLQGLLRHARSLLDGQVDGDAVAAAAETAEKACNDVVVALLAQDVPAKLVQALHILPFESAKRATWLVEALMRPSDKGHCGAAWEQAAKEVEKYVLAKPEMLQKLLGDFESKDKHLADWSSALLRRYAINPALAGAALNAGVLPRLIVLATQKEHFDVALEAFYSLWDFLLGPRPGSAEDPVADMRLSAEQIDALREKSAAWVRDNMDVFFKQFNNMLKNVDGLLRSEALSMLGNLMLGKQSRDFIVEYAQNVNYLVTIMKMFDEDKMTQKHAFHLFKIFAGNPHKSAKVVKMLVKNRFKLIETIKNIQSHDQRHPQGADGPLQEDLSAVMDIVEFLEPGDAVDAEQVQP